MRLLWVMVGVVCSARARPRAGGPHSRRPRRRSDRSARPTRPRPRRAAPRSRSSRSREDVDIAAASLRHPHRDQQVRGPRRERGRGRGLPPRDDRREGDEDARGRHRPPHEGRGGGGERDHGHRGPVVGHRPGAVGAEVARPRGGPPAPAAAHRGGAADAHGPARRRGVALPREAALPLHRLGPREERAAEGGLRGGAARGAVPLPPHHRAHADRARAHQRHRASWAWSSASPSATSRRTSWRAC